MRSPGLIILWIILSVTTLIAQEEPDKCPTISVNGPAGIVSPGEIATYVAQVDTKGQKLSLVYEWSVSAGEIVSGQGTDTIKVKQPDEAVTATVVIGGLPEGCPNEVSESTCGLFPPQPIKLAEIKFPLSSGEKRRLKKVTDGFNNAPNDSYFIFIRYRSKTGLQRIKNQIDSSASFSSPPTYHLC